MYKALSVRNTLVLNFSREPVDLSLYLEYNVIHVTSMEKTVLLRRQMTSQLMTPKRLQNKPITFMKSYLN